MVFEEEEEEEEEDGSDVVINKEKNKMNGEVKPGSGEVLSLDSKRLNKDDGMNGLHPGSIDVDIPLTGEEFLTTISQFAISRSYTIFQAIQLMRLSIMSQNVDSFDRANLAVILWKSTLNRDSFQLVLNVFDAEEDRENIIARIKDCNIGPLSANLLSPQCIDAGGGVDMTRLSPNQRRSRLNLNLFPSK